MTLNITTSAETTIRPQPNKRQRHSIAMASQADACSSALANVKNSDGHLQIQLEHFVWSGGDVNHCSDIPGPPVVPGKHPNFSFWGTKEQHTQNHF